MTPEEARFPTAAVPSPAARQCRSAGGVFLSALPSKLRPAAEVILEASGEPAGPGSRLTVGALERFDALREAVRVWRAAGRKGPCPPGGAVLEAVDEPVSTLLYDAGVLARLRAEAERPAGRIPPLTRGNRILLICEILAAVTVLGVSVVLYLLRDGVPASSESDVLSADTSPRS